MKNQPKNLIAEKTFQFALDSITLYKYLIEQKEFIMSKQFLRSATSIGANVEESVAAQSRKDFISKMYIASKEAKYWLRLLNQSQLVNYNFNQHIEKADEIIRILSSIVKTSQEKLREGSIQNSKLNTQN